MKISTETLEVLANFSNVNPSIAVNVGNVIKTRNINSDSPTAKSTVEEYFPVQFAIYNLKTFLSIVGLFESPDFEFSDTYVTISEEDGSRKAVYRYCDRLNLTLPNYERDHKLPTTDAVVEITQGQIQQILRSANTLRMPDLAFFGDGTNIYVKTYNSTIPQSKNESDTFMIKLGESDLKFNYIFNTQHFIFMKKDYKLSMCLAGIFKFEATDDSVVYWVAPSKKSTKE